MRKMDVRKGFVFTVIAMALLSYLVLSVSMWAQVMAAREANVPQKYKADSLRLLIGEINEAKANEFAQRAAMYALYRLGDHTVTESGLYYDTRTPSDTPYFARNLNTSMHELITTGYTNGGHGTNWATPLNYTNDTGYTLNGWMHTINDTANALGLVVEMDGPYNFSFNQTTPWEMQVSYRLNVSARDMENTMSFEKELNISTTIQLEGYDDPMIGRGYVQDHMLSGETAAYPHRQIRQMKEWARDAGSYEPEPIDVAPNETTDGTNGIGWFYGPINTTGLTPPNPNDPHYADEIKLMNESILYVQGWSDDILGVVPFYGAIIIGDKPNLTRTRVTGACNYTTNVQTECLNCLEWRSDISPAGCTTPNLHIWANNILTITGNEKPYMAGVDTDTGSTSNPDWYDELPATTNGVKHVLIDNEFSNWGSDWDNERGWHNLWNIEKLRDMAICGLYVRNPDAPSYTQKLMDNAVSLDGGDYGIETFVVGRWAGGSLDPDNEGNSRVDHVFYGNSPSGVPVKGMPGCKSEEMCLGDAAVDESVGHFRIDQAHSYGDGDYYTYGVCDIWYGQACSEVVNPREID